MIYFPHWVLTKFPKF